MTLHEQDEELPSLERLAGRTGKLEITLAAIGRQVERITEHLSLAADEDGGPVTTGTFMPPQYPYWPPAPEQAGPRVHFTVQAGSLLTISWAGELRTVICAGTGPGGMLLRDLTADEQAELERQQDAGDEARRREAP